jgi:hypothetical protein
MPGVCLPLELAAPSPRSRLSITTRKTLWLRLLRSFQSVLAVRRLPSPRAMTSFISLRLVTTSSRRDDRMTSLPEP